MFVCNINYCFMCVSLDQLFGYNWQFIPPPTAAPRVGIIMGSDSDLPVMKDAAKILTEFNVPTEVI